ncbi:hypothetical protein GCM10027440_18430 [Nocardiopsis coralliicola]
MLVPTRLATTTRPLLFTGGSCCGGGGAAARPRSAASGCVVTALNLPLRGRYPLILGTRTEL